jgi:hypothetical protein
VAALKIPMSSNFVDALETLIINIKRKQSQIKEDIMDKVKIGDTIKIIKMEGEPQYTDREGVVTHIDDAGQIHGTWGGCAIVPEIDDFIILGNI